jgi:hypothetical protein
MTTPERPARPWDLLNPSIEKIPREVRDRRLGICMTCPHYQLQAKICKKCGCLMPAKTWLPHASCPVGKWMHHETP